MTDGPASPGSSEVPVPFLDWASEETGLPPDQVDLTSIGAFVEENLGEDAVRLYWEDVEQPDLPDSTEQPDPIRVMAWWIIETNMHIDPKFHEALEASGSGRDGDPDGEQAKAALEEFAANLSKWLGY